MGEGSVCFTALRHPCSRAQVPVLWPSPLQVLGPGLGSPHRLTFPGTKRPPGEKSRGFSPGEQLCLWEQISQGPNQRSEELVVLRALKNSTRVRHGEDSSKISREVSSKGVFFCFKHIIYSQKRRSKKPFGALSSVPWFLQALDRLPQPFGFQELLSARNPKKG